MERKGKGGKVKVKIGKEELKEDRKCSLLTDMEIRQPRELHSLPSSICTLM